MKLIKFSLPTCRPCVTLSEQMKELDLSNFEVQEVSLHSGKESLELGRKYGIKSVPTIVVVDDGGEEIKRIRNIVELKHFIGNFSIFEIPTTTTTFGKYAVGIDDYKEESAKTN